MSTSYEAIVLMLRAQAWGALIVLSLVGWGWVVVRLFFRRTRSYGLGACLGLAFAAFLGGILNLLHLITPGILKSFVLGGALLALWQMARARRLPSMWEVATIRSWRGQWKWKYLLLSLLALYFLFYFIGIPRLLFYNFMDDEPYYLAQPIKMLEAHYLLPDPFSVRRIISSVGASYFVQGLVLCALPIENLHLADQYLGFILMILISLSLARQFRLSPFQSAILVFMALLARNQDQNQTFYEVPSALFLGLALVGAQRSLLQRFPSAQAFACGLIAGTLVSLKSTYLPHAACFCVILYVIWGWKRGWRFALKGWVFSALGCLVVLLPWMLAMRQTSGTYFYPILGPGYYFTAYSHIKLSQTLDPIGTLILGWSYFLPLILLLVTQLFFLRRDDRAGLFLALAAACFMGTLATAAVTGGEASPRYNLPILLPTLLLAFIQFSREKRRRPDWFPGRLIQVGSVLLLLSAYHYTLHADASLPIPLERYYRINQTWRNVPMDWRNNRPQYTRISEALPKDGLILTSIQHPYLLNRLDEHILIADWPGSAGPPPGWPISQNGEALANYLRSQSIRYLAYSYVGNDTLNLALLYSRREKSNSYLKDLSVNYDLADAQYRELAKSRRKIYDDGSVFILDLDTPAP